MMTKHLLRGGLVILAGLVAGTLSFNEPAAQQASKLRILQTNFGGDSIQIIDVATNKVIGEIKGHEGVHGIVTSPDGSRIYISSEAENAVTDLPCLHFCPPTAFPSFPSASMTSMPPVGPGLRTGNSDRSSQVGAIAA